MMEEWYTFNEDKLKIASLITASLVLLVTIYRWLLQKWRNDVNLRKYARFMPLKSSRIRATEELKVEVPASQYVQLTMESDTGVVDTIYDGQAPIGTLTLHLDMSKKEAGDYMLVMTCDDQKAIKKIRWSGLDGT